MQLTEHYWNVNPMENLTIHKAFAETFDIDVLRWQGHAPKSPEGMNTGDDARASGGDDVPPFIFAFVPMWWEDDIKGEHRMLSDGPNYRWQFMVRYPDEISFDDGEKWMMNEVLPCFREQKEVNRMLSSRVLQSVNNCTFHRVVEMWFDGPEEWQTVIEKVSALINKPSWAQTEKFP